MQPIISNRTAMEKSEVGINGGALVALNFRRTCRMKKSVKFEFMEEKGRSLIELPDKNYSMGWPILPGWMDICSASSSGKKQRIVMISHAGNSAAARAEKLNAGMCTGDQLFI